MSKEQKEEELKNIEDSEEELISQAEKVVDEIYDSSNDDSEQDLAHDNIVTEEDKVEDDQNFNDNDSESYLVDVNHNRGTNVMKL